MAANPREQAEEEQRRASDPTVSAFVSAHAGTGKTKLLVDRLLRLMLRGAQPDRILCLTYTKAAAAEMAIRLQRNLGDFVAMPEPALRQKLKELRIPDTPDNLLRARQLFAEVLDLPGGMRISTIHAFCQGLLRRFPLEARLSPHFRLIEEADSRAELDRAREAWLPQAPPALAAALAGLLTAKDLAELIRALDAKHDRLAPLLAQPEAALRAALRRATGARFTQDELIFDHAITGAAADLRPAVAAIAAQGNATCSAKATAMLDWLALSAEGRAAGWETYAALFFKSDGPPCGETYLVNAPLQKARPDLLPILLTEQRRVVDIQDQRAALRTAHATADLLLLAAPILRAYREAKTRAGLVGYDDLIAGSLALLRDPGADWVKYKLDGGIDHVLLDEVQDSAGVQWDVTDALTADFFTGTGAYDGELPRTEFAVGDVKQSIYSFQGAEPHEFARRRAEKRRRVAAGGQTFHEGVLDVSFRSTEAVLRCVDAVFAEGPAARGVHRGAPPAHRVNRAGQGGSVTLWPVAPYDKPEKPPAWTVPTENQTARSAAEELVHALADWIANATRGGLLLKSAGRPARAGDILVLVRHRGAFDRALVRELKKRNVPVAGQDRMALDAQPAVQDLLALCEALVLPQDDLTLAEMLVSPLGGLSDASLMALAAGRGEASLWATLRARAAERPEWQAAHDFLAALLSRADFTAPHALLSEALGPLGGRARLFARLGPEAAEPVDELLAKALHYASLHPPSLQGFLHWLGQSGGDVKREADAAPDLVRIMTVHGAKGLEAPVVILPDTTRLPPEKERLHWGSDPQTGLDVPVWTPRKALQCPTAATLKTATRDAGLEEYSRLLYVALTRARDHLLVCGWAPGNKTTGTHWHDMVAAGLRRAGAVEQPHRWGAALHLACAQSAAPDGEAGPLVAEEAALPAWLGGPPAWRPLPVHAEPALPNPLAPSRPEGASLGRVPAARSPLTRGAGTPAGLRGQIIHSLLQYLPDLPPPAREAAARQYAARFLPGEADSLAAQLASLLAQPEVAPLFGPQSRAEQAITGVVAGRVITGRIDRFAVAAGEILVADYKTVRLPPAQLSQTPVLYLRQMAAYRAVLAARYPGWPVRCLLIWTETASITTLPDALLDQHAPGAAAPLQAVQAA